MMTDVAGRVAAGVALLDERAPGWVDKIDLNRLQIQDGRYCILGQVFGDYFSSIKYLGIGRNGAGKHGFISTEPPFEFNSRPDFIALYRHAARIVNEYAALQGEWTRVITIPQAKSQETVEVKELVNV